MQRLIQLKRLAATTVLGLALMLIPAAALSVPAYAAPVDKNGHPCGGGDQAAQAVLGGISNSDVGANCGQDKVNNLFATVVNVLSLVAGVLAVIVIIYSGLKYMTSGGEQGKVANAKTTLIYAVVGLAVAALAQLFIHVVLYQTTIL